MTTKFYTERVNSMIMKLTSWMQEANDRGVGDASSLWRSTTNQQIR